MQSDNESFWAEIKKIIACEFPLSGLNKLDNYAQSFISGDIFFDRLLPSEQHGCAKGGSTHVIASILAGAKTGSDPEFESFSGFKRELQLAKQQSGVIKQWALKTGCWIDNTDSFLSTRFGPHISEGGEAIIYDGGNSLIKSIGLDYFLLPSLALDRVTLHNAYFPETTLTVIAFGEDATGAFKIIVEQPFIIGRSLSEEEIEKHFLSAGFQLRNKMNWTYSTPNIYLSDLHDENVLLTPEGNICVIDCDIRINTPDLKLGGTRQWTNEVRFRLDTDRFISI